MDKQRWEQIQALFESAMALDASQRDAFLQQACGDDEELKQEVRSLMAADGMANDMLDKVALADDDDNTVTIGISREFGPYKVIGKIGMGGMGIVYKAVDDRLDRRVAVKCLSPQLNMDETVRQRFVTEARAASRLDHPNICVIYDIGETPDGQMYFTMPYYEGDTLKQRIKSGTLAAAEVLTIAMQIGQGLVAAHDEDILHRDIKPANIMLTRDGSVKILDFGVAKIAGVENTGTGAALGTVAYMSPEQLKGEIVDKRTDIWSLGVLIYEMFVGRRPFRGKFTHEVMYSVLNHEPDSISAVVSNAPDMLDDISRRALQRDAGDRYQSVSELLNDLTLLRQRWSTADSVLLKQGLDDGAGDGPSSITNWDQATLETISRELTKYLGPMASIIVKKKSQETQSMKELCESLAGNLSSDEQRQQFLNKVRHRGLASDTNPSGVSVNSQPSQQARKVTAYSEEDLSRLETELMTYIGPISGKLVRRMSKTAPDMPTLCERLTDYLDDNEKEPFLKKTRPLY